MAETAIIDMTIATNSRGCSLIAAASRPALSSATDSLRERLGTFLHPVICTHGVAPVALGHEFHGMICRLKGQSHGNARPLSKPALDIDLAAMQTHQALDDREAKARAVVATITGRASLEKGLSEAWQVGLDDADAGVRNRQRELRPVARCAHRHAATTGGEFDGIGYQIDQDLIKGAPIGRDFRKIGRDTHREL